MLFLRIGEAVVMETPATPAVANVDLVAAIPVWIPTFKAHQPGIGLEGLVYDLIRLRILINSPLDPKPSVACVAQRAAHQGAPVLPPCLGIFFDFIKTVALLGVLTACRRTPSAKKGNN